MHHSELVNANGKFDIEALKKAVSNGWDPKQDDSIALRAAIAGNDKEAFKALLPMSDATANHSIALQGAVYHDRHDMVHELLPHCQSNDDMVHELLPHCQSNDDMVHELLPHCQSNDDRVLALHVAVKHCKEQSFETLLPQCDPRERQGQILGEMDRINSGDYLDHGRMDAKPMTNRMQEKLEARCQQVQFQERLRQVQPEGAEAPRQTVKRRL